MQQEKTWDSGAVQLASTSGKNRIFNALVKGEKNNMENHDESLFDISERMVLREKENAKKALEELWLLKKSCREKDITILDMLIDYYQKKIDSVRQKEERLKKISSESASSIEERKTIRNELAGIVKEIDDCKREIDFLKAKQEKLLIKEKDLKEKDITLMNALENQEKEVLDSLQTVILAKSELRTVISLPAAKEEEAIQQTKVPAVEEVKNQPTAESVPATQVSAPENVSASLPVSIPNDTAETVAVPQESKPNDTAIYRTYKPAEHSRFPKSIVKTDRGRILGEYYYDPKVYKNARHYVFNGSYFAEQIKKGIELYKIDETNTNILGDISLMISDILNRSETRQNIHFEVSTNEILNRNSLLDLIELIKNKDIQQIDNFSSRYNKKIEMLGQNYEQILAEQLANLSNTSNVNG
ncbi:MAG: hypothetical protein JNL74_12275 [Fibrobacteres bacterium]|nr:hypothetical protein [Fibrobacterota bacterium]